MKNRMISVFACWVLGAGWSLAAEPVDNHVKGALLDIERYEKQLAGTTSPTAGTVKRTLKLLTLTRERLDRSENRAHESWIDADKRYKTLVARLNEFLAPKDSQNTQTSSNEADAQKPPAGGGSSTATEPQQMISHYRVQIKKIARDIQTRIDTMDSGGVKPFQDAEYVGTFQQAAQRFRESLGTFADYKDDPDVVTAAELLVKFESMIEFGRGYAAKEMAELGDVQGRLRNINERIRKLQRPPAPQEPYEAGELGQWLTQLATMRGQAMGTLEPLPVIKQKAYLPDNPLTVEQGGPYDAQDVDRLERSLVDLVNGIDTDLKAFGEHLDHVVGNVKAGLAYYREFDPADRSDQANHFLSAGRADEIRARLARDRQTALEAAQYAQLISDPSYRKRLGLVKAVPATAEPNVPPATTNAVAAQAVPAAQASEATTVEVDPIYQERLVLVKEIEAVAALYEANYQKARRLVRMPEAATDDSELVAIARKTLANYDYVGDIKRLVVNTEKAHRSKETSEAEYDNVDVSLSGTVTLTGTRTTYSYEWDEFQVATAEPVGDAHYIFYTTLKYFTAGGSTTPLNKWIVSARLQSCEIPEENIDK